MNHLIQSKIDEQIKLAASQNQNISEDRAFSYALVSLFDPTKETHSDIESCVTDGANDGGIDFILFDDDEMKLIVCQSKMTSTFDANMLFSELDKMQDTVSTFQEMNPTGKYNERLRKTLRNGLDNLSDELPSSIEYRFCTTANVNTDSLLKKLDSSNREITSESVTIYSEVELVEEIERDWETTSTVPEFKFDLDESNNYLEYSAGNLKGAMVNISSKSITALYDSYANSGLFDLNIRKYIKSRTVDNGINDTLNKHRDEFWFLNNGLTIVCSDYGISGDKIKIFNFSIVNGGQTTYLIGNYKGSNKEVFYIPCKVVCDSSIGDEVNEKSLAFFSKIAQATNSQKKISARDLRSNSPEMKNLQALLKSKGIYLEIKRGDKSPAAKKCNFTIKNEDFTQIYTSFVCQLPGTARNKKAYLFENDQAYNRVFRQNYSKDANRTNFIVDLVNLYQRYLEVEKKLKTSLVDTEYDIIANGKFMIFALFGVLYAIKNNDTSISDIQNNPDSFFGSNFIEGSFISEYTDDDLDELIENAVSICVQIAADTYRKLLLSKSCSSVSNFLKSDALYRDVLVKDLAFYMDKLIIGKQLIPSSAFLKRTLH